MSDGRGRKCKQYKTKYTAVQKELETAEITVKELTSVVYLLKVIMPLQ